ncbi:MAG TPA: (Fe-S)-binding protein [Selenomonadales bacterium]|nr:(Fe-S)-binding protein [Selenomonadales bacterium]
MKVPLHLAKEREAAAVGFPAVPAADLKDRLIKEIEDYRGFSRSLAVMLETCTKCGACAKQCHSYLGTGDYNNIPAARADLFRRLYKRYFTWAGKAAARFSGAAEYDAGTLAEWVTYFYQCNECRRCAVFCPFGIDTAEITIAARHILTRLGILPRFMAQIAANMAKTGNNMGIPKPALIDCCEFMEDEIREETGVKVQIPVDKPDADILYVPSSADFFTNADTMIGVAKLFHALKVDWTISSTVLEAANFGLLFNLDVMKDQNRRLREAAAGAKLVVQGECGHGWRAAKMYTEGAGGPAPFALVHILDFAARQLPKLKLNKLPWRVTLHDPCNYARAGDIVAEPRAILRACVSQLIEMTPNRERNFCCGGGSGILMDEMLPVRVQLGRKKAEQVKELGPLDYLAAPCSICKAQLPPVLKHYGLEELKVGGVMDVLGKALIVE